MPRVGTQPQSQTIHRLVLISFAALCALVLPRNFRSYELSPVKRLIAQRLSRSSPTRHAKYTVSACVIIKDASTILPEFIIRNYIAGVDHFFIYGDDSEEEELSRVEKVIAIFQSFVTFFPNGRSVPDDEEDPERYVQMRIYRHCVTTFGQHTHWMAFIDSDEFFETDILEQIEPRKSRTGRHAFLHDILMHYDRFPVLCLRWRTILTNGKLLPAPNGATLLDHFPVSCKEIVNNTIKLSLRKTIVQPRHVNLSLTAKLDVALHKGFRLRHPHRKFHCIRGVGAEMQSPLYLAHYWSRSVLDYFQKIERGRPRQGVPSRTLTDLIKREAVCQPDESSAVAVARKDFLRSFVEAMKIFKSKPLSAPTIEKFMRGVAHTDDNTLCAERIRLLLHKVAAGYMLSPERYCEQVQNTSVCSTPRTDLMSHVWPLAWVEFLGSCKTELDCDKLFVRPG